MNLFTSSTFSCDTAREVSPRSTQDSLPRDGSPSYRFVTSRWCVSRKGGAVRPSHLASSPRPERRSGLAKIEQARDRLRLPLARGSSALAAAQIESAGPAHERERRRPW